MKACSVPPPPDWKHKIVNNSTVGLLYCVIIKFEYVQYVDIRVLIRIDEKNDQLSTNAFIYDCMKCRAQNRYATRDYIINIVNTSAGTSEIGLYNGFIFIASSERQKGHVSGNDAFDHRAVKPIT